MQEQIEPDENHMVDELRLLRPMQSSKSKMDLCYSAGYAAAQKRACCWHAAAIFAFIGLGGFAVSRPSPKASVQFVDRVVYVQPPYDPLQQMPSLAGVLENRRQMEEALQDKWTVSSSHGSTSAPPVIGAWMSDLDSKKLGGL